MIKITTEAQEKLQSYLEENQVTPTVRIYLPQCGCSGGGDQLSLTIDDSNDADISVPAGKLTLFIDKELSNQVGQVTIDFKEEDGNIGFYVTSEKPLPASTPSSCGGGCSGCC